MGAVPTSSCMPQVGIAPERAAGRMPLLALVWQDDEPLTMSFDVVRQPNTMPLLFLSSLPTLPGAAPRQH